MDKLTKIIAVLCFISMLVIPVSIALADDAGIDQEIDSLRTKIAKLEKKAVSSGSPMSGDGLVIGGGATFVIQASRDANSTSYEGEDVTDATYSVDIDLEKSVGDNGKVFVTLEAGSGNGLDGEEVTLFGGVNADVANTMTDLEVVQVGYEQSLLDDKAMLTAGKLDSTLLFDENAIANDETTQFLAPAFRNSAAIAFPDSRYVLGAALAIQATDMLELKGGILEDNHDSEDVLNDNFFYIQAAVSPELQGKEGTYRLYGWYDTASHVKLDDITEQNEKNYGFGLSCDQVITDKITGFARVGVAKDDVSAYKLAWSLGADVACPKYEGNNLGIAVGQIKPSSKYDDLGIPDNKETQLEIYYKIQVNDAVAISPDLQVIWNPNGVKEASEGRNDTIIVGGIRGQLDF